MGYLICLISDDVMLREQLQSAAGAQSALDALSYTLGVDTYPARDSGGLSRGAWMRLGSSHSQALRMICVTDQGAWFSQDPEEVLDCASAWVPSSSGSAGMRSVERDFLRAPQRYPHTLALMSAGVPGDAALHGTDSTTSTRISLWTYHADQLPFLPIAASALHLRTALHSRSAALVQGSRSANVVRVGGVTGQLGPREGVWLFASGNRMCRFEDLTEDEKARAGTAGYRD